MISQLAGLFQAPAILRETLKAVRQKEELLLQNCERDCEMLQAHLNELKQKSLKEEIDYDEVKKAATMLTESRHSKRPVRYMSGGRTNADRKLKNYFEMGFQNGGSRESI